MFGGLLVDVLWLRCVAGADCREVGCLAVVGDLVWVL